MQTQQSIPPIGHLISGSVKGEWEGRLRLTSRCYTFARFEADPFRDKICRPGGNAVNSTDTFVKFTAFALNTVRTPV